MLYLARKVGESVMINDTIEVRVEDVRGKTVRLSFAYPEGVQILRREVFDRIEEENQTAASSLEALQRMLGGSPHDQANDSNAHPRD